MTIVCDGSTTKFYTNGNDTPIGSQNHSYPRAEDTGAAREVFIIGNADYNRKGIGDLYGFRLYNQNYLPSEIEDPLPSESPTETTENSTPTTEVSVQTFSLSSGVYNIVVDKPYVTFPSPIVTIDMEDTGNIIYGGTADYVGMITNPGYWSAPNGNSHADHYNASTTGPSKITDGPDGKTAMNFSNSSRIFLTKPSGQGGVAMNSTWTIDCYMRGNSATNGQTIAYAYDTHINWFGHLINNNIGVYNNLDEAGTNRGNFNNTHSGYTVPIGTWIRMTIVCDGTTTKFYVDGNDAPVGSTDYSFPRDADTGGRRELFIVGNYDLIIRASETYMVSVCMTRIIFQVKLRIQFLQHQSY